MTTRTRSAQPTAAAVVDSEACRERHTSSNPSPASTTGTHCRKSASCSVATTCVMSGSNVPRNVGSNAVLTRACVAAAAVFGTSITQFATVVPTTASGFRAASGPQPRSYVFHRSPAYPYCSKTVVLEPSANGSPAGGSSPGPGSKKPARPRPGTSGVGASLQSNGVATAADGPSDSPAIATSSAAGSRATHPPPRVVGARTFTPPHRRPRAPPGRCASTPSQSCPEPR